MRSRYGNYYASVRMLIKNPYKYGSIKIVELYECDTFASMN